MSTDSRNVEGFDIWEVDHEYEIIRIIGFGAFGSVGLAKHKPSGMLVAVKKIDFVFADLKDCRRILREIQMLRCLNHPNIVKIIDIMHPKDIEHYNELYIVLEYFPSDLLKFINSKETLTSTIIKKIMYNILQGVKYLHTAYVVHRDLKPSNILIDPDCTVKLCDFDLSRNIKNKTSSVSPFKPTFENSEVEIQDEISLSKSIPANHDPPEFFNKKHYLPSKKSPDKFSERKFDKIAEEDCKSEKDDAISRILFRDVEEIKFGFPSLNPMNERNERQHFQAEKIRQFNKFLSKHERQLSEHVCTRFYRAPEIILRDKNYTFASDIWSLGCVFAELLQLKGKKIRNKDFNPEPIFIGDFCSTMSPKVAQLCNRETLDQIESILNIIGPLTEDDASFIEDNTLQRRLMRIKPNKSFKEICPNASEEELYLLKKMLDRKSVV